MNQTIQLLSIACALSVAALTVPSHAEISYSEVPDDPSSMVIKMRVTPAAQPKPVFEHRFVTEDIELKSGNAAPYYYRALLDLPRRMDAARKKYNQHEEMDNWGRPYDRDGEATSLDKLPLEKVRDAVEMTIGGSGVWDQLVEATSRRDCDFQLGLSEVRGPELIYILLEEFQRSREISRMLALRTRLEVAEKRFDDAVATMRMNYRLARDFGSAPFIVSGLIGIAEANMTNGTALEMLAQPGSPNLYWAFSELPSPLIDMRAAARFELDFGPRIFSLIHNAQTTTRSAEEWNRLLVQTFRDLITTGGDLQLFGGEPVFSAGDLLKTDYGAGYLATTAGLMGYSHAKTQLIAQGFDKERVEKMPVGQVMAIYTERNYQMFADEWEASWYMPFWEARRRENDLEKHIAAARIGSGGEEREVIPIVSLLLPAMQAARQAQVRSEREIASLRVIEALRMYAADHAGKLPLSLDDIRHVPVPTNPATGKAFVYHIEGDTAVLELPASDGIHGSNRRYEIQISK
jgi:hypothetical protein